MSRQTPPASAPAARSIRYVIATRKSLFTLLLEQHGTLGQSEFYLRSRGQRIEDYAVAHERFEGAVSAVEAALPHDARRARVDRDQLDRFLFEPGDVVIVVGQDGLVPNVAKYLSGQPVIGVNPDPDRYDGVLCRVHPEGVGAVVRWTAAPDGAYALQPRTMAVAQREDGQRLHALNEVFIGHRTHQSARYRLVTEGGEERQSSSGLICATGTGATGWARSINGNLAAPLKLPSPAEARLCWFVREPFPSVSTGTKKRSGLLTQGEALIVCSEMPDGGVIFADGLEADRLEFLSGQAVSVGVSPTVLNLVVPVSQKVETGRQFSSAGSPASRRTRNQPRP